MRDCLPLRRSRAALIRPFGAPRIKSGACSSPSRLGEEHARIAAAYPFSRIAGEGGRRPDEGRAARAARNLQSSIERREDRLLDAFEVVANVDVADPQDAITFAGQKRRSPLVVGNFFIGRVRRAVHLDDEEDTPAQKIHDVGPDGSLPDELPALEATTPEASPEEFLGRGELFSERPGTLGCRPPRPSVLLPRCPRHRRPRLPLRRARAPPSSGLRPPSPSTLGEGNPLRPLTSHELSACNEHCPFGQVPSPASREKVAEGRMRAAPRERRGTYRREERLSPVPPPARWRRRSSGRPCPSSRCVRCRRRRGTASSPRR